VIEKDLKEKIKKIYQVLPKLDDRRCGYRTCGEFAKSVARGEAPCDGCVTGGYETARKVCAIMGEKVENKEKYESKYKTGHEAFAGIPRRAGGRGRRYRSRFFNFSRNTNNYDRGDAGPGQEKIILKQQAEYIKKRLHDIEKRLGELEKNNFKNQDKKGGAKNALDR